MGRICPGRGRDNQFNDTDLTVIELVVFATVFTLIVLLTGRI